MYSATTKAIRVTVEPTFLDDQSTPADNHYVWAYQVKIENTGVDTVKLINRCWRITDAMGRMQEVRGRGVVGEQPQLAPGEQMVFGVALDRPRNPFCHSPMPPLVAIPLKYLCITDAS